MRPWITLWACAYERTCSPLSRSWDRESTIAKLQICAYYSKVTSRRWSESSWAGTRAWLNHGLHVRWRGCRSIIALVVIKYYNIMNCIKYTKNYQGMQSERWLRLWLLRWLLFQFLGTERRSQWPAIFLEWSEERWRPCQPHRRGSSSPDRSTLSSSAGKARNQMYQSTYITDFKLYMYAANVFFIHLCSNQKQRWIEYSKI